MNHPTLQEAIESCLLERKDKWDQFFNGELFLSRMESQFTESAFVYEDKIWYGEEIHGSGSFYNEGSVKKVLSLFLDPATEFIKSKLKEKMDEILEKRKEGFLITNGLGKFDFQNRTTATWKSNFAGEEDLEVDMFGLGEHIALLSMNSSRWKYVKA